jgi:hypothetical protein
MRSMRKCVYRKQLDLEMLVATRGPNFPLSRLESRLMCPACGNRRVTVVFEPPAMRRWVTIARAPTRSGPSRVFSRYSCEMVSIGEWGLSLEIRRRQMTENVSRRKMLSLLGFGAAIALAAAAVPFEADAQTLAQAAPDATPATPATTPGSPAPSTGTRGRNRRTSRRTTRHNRRAARHGKPAEKPETPAPAPAQ